MVRGCLFTFSLLFLALFVACDGSKVSVIQTTDGALDADRVGIILPHEHIFTDLRGPETPGYGQADIEDVIRVMKPLLAEAKARGVDVLVECSSVGIGRNVPVLARLSKETGLHIVVPTGVYARANLAPKAYREMSEAELTAWMVREIREGIEGTDIRAGFIKLGCSESGLTELEERLLRASAKVSLQTGVVIASHTTSGAVAVKQVDILQEERLPLDRFIWVHAQAKDNMALHKQLAARGVYIEYDSIGGQHPGDERSIEMIKDMISAGHLDRLLLSHDAGWYNPGEPNGGKQTPYTYLFDTFLPKLQASGVDEATIKMLTVENPRRAYARITGAVSRKQLKGGTHE